MYKKVYVEITNICNMHCSFCHGHSRAPGKMRPEDFQHILRQLQGQTQYIYYHLMGEPCSTLSCRSSCVWQRSRGLSP